MHEGNSLPGVLRARDDLANLSPSLSLLRLSLPGHSFEFFSPLISFQAVLPLLLLLVAALLAPTHAVQSILGSSLRAIDALRASEAAHETPKRDNYFISRPSGGELRPAFASEIARTFAREEKGTRD